MLQLVSLMLHNARASFHIFLQWSSVALETGLAAGLAGRAVVCLVLAVSDPRSADGTWLAKATVDGHLGTERGHVRGKSIARFVPQAVYPR